jgi:hypothetical protein
MLVSGRSAELQVVSRLKVLNDEADRQREIAADRIATTHTKASFLLVGAGVIAGSMGPEEVSGVEGILALAALVAALAAGIFAIVSLAPAPSLVLSIDALEERVRGAESEVEVQELLLETKSVSITELNSDNTRRAAWNVSGYVALSAAFLLAVASWSVVLIA